MAQQSSGSGAKRSSTKSGSTSRSSASSKSKASYSYSESGEFAAGDACGTALIDGFGFTSKPVVWADIDGMAVVEGDIVIGTVEEALERDVSKLTSDPEGLQFSVGISGAQFRWPNGRVPFEIDPGLTNQSRVTNAIAHWESNTPLEFVQRTTETDFVRFVGGSGCSSHVGRRGGMQQITLGTGCSLGSTIHEIGHAVGLWHEQSREDRDTFVEIRFANITAGKEHNFNQHISDGDDLGAYDFGSIMHYSATAFSKNGQPTIVPRVPLPAGVTMGQRNGLSAGDINGVKLMYPNLNWPKAPILDITKRPDIEVFKNPAIDGPKRVKEIVKEPVKEIQKEVVKDPASDPIKRPPSDPVTLIEGLGTLVENVRVNPRELVTNPFAGRGALPFVLGRQSDFVSHYQEALAGGQGLGGGADAAEIAQARAIALADAVTALDQVRVTLAALAEDLANEAGV
ncbi:M12 family metallopeptidase [Agromyces mangrovi Wang et al. 2018]|uniref:M12 family metallopeptidase n=1 Tax=Agromyces mangrovi TaxID=1858653 RepID=UPI002572CE30|nr:M12 family metallopeptidase [Agromyces mangrovi]BDZ64357.1 hypothetical protein GCM10025877_12950 [Agromyces mangrovi]